MAQQSVSIGSSANDGTGDPLRTAFTKINANFSELYGDTAEANDILDDTSPQLGGNLDINGFNITSARSNEDIVIAPSGTGGVLASGLRLAGTTISADDSSTVNINEGLNVDGAITVEGATTLSGALAVTGVSTLSGSVVMDNITIDQSTISSSSNADINITPGGTGNIVAGAVTINGTTLSAADSSKITIAEALDVTGATTLSGLAYPTSDGDSGQVLQTDGSGTLSWASVSLGDLSIIGATIAAPSNAPLTLISSGSSVNIEGLSVAGNVISTTDSSAGVEITGNLIPSADGIYQLGSSSKRWQTAYLSAETLDIGGATISSDGTGSIAIAATGATLPSGSKVGTQNLMLGGKTTGSSGRPVQLVEVFVSDGSTVRSDAQILAQTANLELEFNGTVDDTPVYTEAQQTFTLSTGATLASNQTGVTLFQF